ncbi:MAG: hypothetical protein E6I90_13170 [Chloroflexi bacterium]|nr:MAG: hypothetical protein E6I90_13170 [Chloroflexota bacterium]
MHEIERFRRSYKSEADLPVVLALKQICTTAQNIYDALTTSDLRRLLAPFSALATTTSSKQSWEEARRGMSPERAQRAITHLSTWQWYTKTVMPS